MGSRVRVKMLHCDIIVVHVQCLVRMVVVIGILAMHGQMLQLARALRHRHRAEHRH